MDNKDAYIEQLENTIKSLKNQVNNLTKMILLLRKEKFGSTSEKTHKKDIDGQISFFNEAELEADVNAHEPITHEVKGYARTDSRTKREELIKDLPVREILCESAAEDQYCIQCGIL
ncbi:MAG: transposase domain-containing protein [Solirubrobacterales bacterium]